MSDQLSLPGMSQPARWGKEGLDRLFLAILPDINSAEYIEQLARRFRASHSLRSRPYPADRLHITLHHLGDFDGVPDGIIETTSECVAEVAASIRPFEVRFYRAQSFQRKSGKRPLVLLGDDRDNAVLMELQRRLGTVLGRREVPYDKKFKPHVTLLRDEQIVAEQAIEPVIWMVNEIVLVHSLLGQTRYLFPERWTLQG